jgi:hypothetical protein
VGSSGSLCTLEKQASGDAHRVAGYSFPTLNGESGILTL